MSFHYRGLECKSRKSRNTWSNRQIWPWSTEWCRTKANKVLPRECTGHSKHPLTTIQEKTLHMDITRWSGPKSDWLYSWQPKLEKLYTVSKNKTRSWLWLRSWRSPGSGASSPSSYKWVILVRSETQSPHQQNGCNARTYTIHWLSELNKMIHNEPCISGKFCACLSLGIAFRKCRVIWASQSQEMGQSTW